VSDERPVTLSSHGPPSTVLDPEPDDALVALADALTHPTGERHQALAAVCARWPRCLDAWARLGDASADDVEAYAYYRVGYHRGLDRLRQNGWRGSGYVRWSHPENRGFLRALAGLQRTAAAFGEHDEAQRCQELLVQLDPDWSRVESEASATDQ
jgi:Protein of unknown function (DUF3151)